MDDEGIITGVNGPNGEVFTIIYEQTEDDSSQALEEIEPEVEKVTQLQKQIAAGLATFQFMFLLKDQEVQKRINDIEL